MYGLSEEQEDINVHFCDMESMDVWETLKTSKSFQLYTLTFLIGWGEKENFYLWF